MKAVIPGVAVCLSFFYLFSCVNPRDKGERLAKQYCASCHQFPDPGLLDKNTWSSSVLPQMAFRMGVDYSMLSSISSDDYPAVMSVLPGKAMVTADEWEAIKSYYADNAPDSLSAPVADISHEVNQFDVEPFRSGISPLLTIVKYDTLTENIFIGSRLRKLYRLSEKFVVEDSFQLSSPPSQIHLTGHGEAMVLLMGIMDPNDQAKGQLVRLNMTQHTMTKMVDSLKRPVHFEEVDLNGDGLKEVIVSAFGNYSGALLLYKNLGGGNFEKQILQNLPGARKVVTGDFDNNGLVDILAMMSQGDEKIILLLNQGDFNFRINTLLNFSPVYGSSYFEVVDFNKDGRFDILYTNGDNADYSTIPKPYHGVRIFLNNGKNDFTESWFYNMHGASQAVARDFDLDGDLDIAAISFFPDFKNHAEQGFIYFENNEGKFIPHTTPAGASGRWITMDASDFDRDGDCDLLLGALNFNSGVPTQLLNRWANDKISVLILRNTLK